MNQNVYIVGLNHRTAGVEVREKFALTECNGPEQTLFPLGDPVRELVVLSTCNRVEIMTVGPGPEAWQRVVLQWAASRGLPAEELLPYTYVHEDLDAVRHLFSVASSLDSMVLGEPQILGQLKQAYRQAAEHKTTKIILNRLLHKAFSVAKRVRTETDIGASAVSISYAAVELAKRIFGDMSQYKAMLIGAGEMAELAATHLMTSGIRKIYVANRTFERAETMARQFKGEAIAFEQLFDKLAEADIVISSTGAPQAIIRAKDIKETLKRRKNRPMFFIDIAVPRDIDPDVNSLDNVYLYDIDDLKEVVEENLAQRRGEAARAKAIVEVEAEAFGRWMKSLAIQPTIVDLMRQGEAVAAREAAKTVKRLAQELPEINEKTREAVAVLAASMVKKLYHEPIAFLKDRLDEETATQQYIDITRRMFNLDNDRQRVNGDADKDEGEVPDESNDEAKPSESSRTAAGRLDPNPENHP